MESEPPRSVFILKPSSFGDIIHTLPAVARLKSAWPATRVTWMVNPEWMPLLEGNADVDEIVAFPRRDFMGWGGWRRFFRWQRREVRGRRPDLVLDFQGLLRTAIIGRLSKPRSFYGMADAREGSRFFYDDVAPLLKGVPHAVERYLSLVDLVLHQRGRKGKSPQPISPLRWPLPPGEPLKPQDFEKIAGDFVILNPFSRGPGKSLSHDQVLEFCRRLAPYRVVLVGGGGSEDQHAFPGALNLLGRTTLPQLIWTTRRAAFVISVDSGPAHLAAALGKSLVAVHTWSDPRKVGPYCPDAWVWKSGQLLRMRDVAAMSEAFFAAAPPILSASQIRAICERVTSPSGFYA